MSKIFGKMVKNERYFLDYFSFLIYFIFCLFSACEWRNLKAQEAIFQFMRQQWAQLLTSRTSPVLRISIYASREGCNAMMVPMLNDANDFNSCIPYGMQLCLSLSAVSLCLFQFMHPLWDATILPHYCAGSQYYFNSCARDGRNCKI